MTQLFTDAFRQEFDKQALQVGRFNLAIFGKTGVGKSTLVNKIFGQQVAATGTGAPVTESSHLYLHQHGTLGILDTSGVEVGRDDALIIRELTDEIKDRRKKGLSEQIHVAWYCVHGLNHRFEDLEADFVRAIAALDVPVILVLTHVPVQGADYHPDAVALAEYISSLNLPIVGGRPFMTNAVRDPFLGQPEHGLMDVLQATFHVVPTTIRTALTAAQVIDLAAKARSAQTAIGATVAAAGAAAATPIPFSAATVLVPLQLGMMARIAHVYQIPFDKAAFLAVASTTAATQLGRTAASSLLQLIPGAGSVVGGVINASVATSFTFAMGQAWLTVCQKAAGGGLPTLDGITDTRALRELFEAELKKRMPTGRT